MCCFIFIETHTRKNTQRNNASILSRLPQVKAKQRKNCSHRTFAFSIFAARFIAVLNLFPHTLQTLPTIANRATFTPYLCPIHCLSLSKRLQRSFYAVLIVVLGVSVCKVGTYTFFAVRAFLAPLFKLYGQFAPTLHPYHTQRGPKPKP